MELEVKYDAQMDALLSGNLTAEMLKAIGNGLGQAAQELTTLVQERIVSNRSVKSGRLLSSIMWDQPNDWTVRVGSMEVGGHILPYAAQVEFGGPIEGRPTLAWPVSPEFGGIIPTPSGVGGANASDVDPGEFGATGTFVRPSHTGRTKILFYKGPGIGQGGEDWAPAFVLSPGVNQPGKPYLTPVVTDQGPAIVMRALEDALVAAGVFQRS